jgi:hypothetical protein
MNAEVRKTVPLVLIAIAVCGTFLSGNYGEAGALDLYGGEYELPLVISGSICLWYQGCGEFEPETVIVAGFEGSDASHFVRQCKFMDTVKDCYGVKNDETTHHTEIYACR